MTKYALPNANSIGSGNLTNEYYEYDYLYNLVPRTTTGDISFTSSSSNIIYATATYNNGIYANQGQNGMLSLLGEIVISYNISPTDFNNKVEQTDFNTHLADNTYQTAGGTATAITLTIGETLSDGLPVNFKCATSNAGAATTINTKPFYKPGGTVPPNLIAGKYYTGVYNVAGACFFIKASASGTLVASQALAGILFSNENDTDIPGTMPNNGAFNLGLGVSVPAGYYSGGTTASGKRWQSGSVISTTTTETFTYAGSAGTIGQHSITVSGLTFKPSVIIAKGKYSSVDIITHYEELAGGIYVKTSLSGMTDGASPGNAYEFKGDIAPGSVTATGFTLPVNTNGGGISMNYIAIE